MRPPSRLNSFISYKAFIFGLLITLPACTAHSWLDCSNMLDSGCAGYPRGYPSRADADINTKYTYLVKDRRPDAPLCQPGLQDIPGNNPFPPAVVTPGQSMHLKWQPDGHLDDLRPSTVEIHWTGVPYTQLYTRSQISDSTRLTSMIFATSDNCDQASEPNTWCHGYLTVPPGIQPGTYQMIWWWKYDRNPSGEEYSTCFEIVVPESVIQPRDDSTPIKVINEALPTVPSEVENAEGTAAQTFELAYMVEEDPRPKTDSTLLADDSKSEALADLVTKSDEPISNIPNHSIDSDSKLSRFLDTDSMVDETGDLAGDAVNIGQDVDHTPVSMSTPSQFINNTLIEPLRSNTANHRDAKNASSTTNPVSSGSTANSTVSSPTPENSTDTSSPRNRPVVGQTPSIDNGASDSASHSFLSGIAIISSTLVALTYLIV
ncbi:hypothetical protein BGZ76_007062 [Entomortierella beljakovae]|nr:hypothetical protein BGZ76_007062 [Entomortierella beljakovae]